MPKKIIDYSKTVIYEIVNKESKCCLYIGSTTNFINRKNKHKYNINNEVSKDGNFKVYNLIRSIGGWDSIDIIPIEKYTDCKDSLDQRMRERHYYNLRMPEGNTNKPSITKEETKEYIKQYFKDTEYYKNNSAAIIESVMRTRDKEAYKLYQKEYRLKNKEKLNEYNRLNKYKYN